MLSYFTGREEEDEQEDSDDENTRLARRAPPAMLSVSATPQIDHNLISASTGTNEVLASPQ